MKQRLLPIIFALHLSACGTLDGISVGNAIWNETLPAGERIAQGTFVGQSGVTASGVAAIIRSSTGKDIIRLEGVRLPSGGNLRILAVLDGQTVNIATLRSPTGNQNYTTGLGGQGSTWSSVSVYSPATLQYYATAILLQ